MRILVSNDDGIHAPGIRALAAAMEGLGDVVVVAPDSERSAVGHAITLTDPIKTREVRESGGFVGHAVGGTPADSVKLAVCALLPEPPDLVVSGINLGPNAGIAVIYSGTVSAATEGTILGIPSMAVSLNTFRDPLWDTAARVARDLAERLVRDPLPKGVLLNVNVPNLPFGELRGFAVTRMAPSRFVETFDKRADPRGNIYYWMDGYLEPEGDPAGTDLHAVANGWVSMTPIHFDLTHAGSLGHLRAWAASSGAGSPRAPGA
jgi:5'-nucleotidase